MKDLIFALAFMLIGTFAFANTNAKEEIVVEKQAIELTVDLQEDILVTKCYKLVYDVFGNPYFIEVPCPPIIIIIE